jgi:uncharacterized protein (TIGR00369 family)
VADFASPRDLAQAAVGGDPAALERYFSALKERQATRGPHMGTLLGIETLEIAKDYVVMRLPFREELRRGGGIFHGGAIMALADHVAGAVFNTDPRVPADGATGLTTDFNVSFLLSAMPGEALVATGSVLRRGKNVTFMQVEIRGETSARAVATCRTTYLTVPRDRLGR